MGKLEAVLDEIPAPAITELVPGFAELFDRKTFREPLSARLYKSAMVGPVRRGAGSPYGAQGSGASGGRSKPAGCAATIRRSRRRGGSYAMAMSGFLVKEKHFGFDDQGKLAAPAGAIKACEERRKKVNDLVAILADPKSDTPVFEEAVRFADSEPEHRKSLIHRREARLERKDALSVKGN